ncbi:MAG TPA: LPXTG cell wall anchor domain-containing protein, partial [Phycicoccus sp.]|nr:LPXTG cell wall anchor domain-containing protein [Phycicoccus sp.]
PVRFKTTGNGITIVTDAGQNNAGVIAVVGDTFTISITDTKVGPLPEAGGKGPAPYAVLGLLLILTGAAYHHRNFRVRGRHAAI